MMTRLTWIYLENAFSTRYVAKGTMYHLTFAQGQGGRTALNYFCPALDLVRPPLMDDSAKDV